MEGSTAAQETAQAVRGSQICSPALVRPHSIAEARSSTPEQMRTRM